MSKQKAPPLVVALDIGTTNSGYAWQWREDFQKKAPVQVHNWRGPICKTSTAILFSDIDLREVNSIGFEAEGRYGRQGAERVHANWRLFKNFKIFLYGEEFKPEILIEDVESQVHIPLKTVMANFIRQLQTHFLYSFNRAGHDLAHTQIQWVITVPAIWNDAAKYFMRLCAEAAGIESDKLMMVLEPDAATFYCIRLPEAERRNMDMLGSKGDKFVLADLGGGTADISVQTVREDGNLEQLCPPDGERVGSNDINNAFFMACKEQFDGSTWFESFANIDKENQLNTMHDFQNSFEMQKCELGLTENVDNELLNIQLPYALAQKCEKGELKLKPGCEIFKIEGGRFKFQPNFIRETLFKTTVSRIFEALRKVLVNPKVTAVEKVIFVGGLAESCIAKKQLMERLRNAFPDRNIKVFTPIFPMYAVLKGAVMFGHDPRIFRTRISKWAYGIAISKPFDARIHPKENRYESPPGGKAWCRDVFDIHIAPGERIEVDKRFLVRRYEPVVEGKQEMKILLYISPDAQTTCVSDPRCRLLATIKVDFTNSPQRSADVSMIYGGSEIRVEAIEKATGKLFKTHIFYENISNPDAKPEQSGICVLF